MGKIYHLNKIKIKTEEDLLEFMDMVAAKITEGKSVIKKGQMERQSLRNRVAMPVNPQHLRVKDEAASVLDRATGSNVKLDNVENTEEINRINQLRQAQAPVVTPKPGDIGELDFNNDEDDEAVVPPSKEDLTPVGDTVDGKAQSIKNAQKRSGLLGNLRKK